MKQGLEPVRTSSAQRTLGMMTPAAPQSMACWQPLRSRGPPTFMSSIESEASPIAVCMPAICSCESGLLTGSTIRKSHAHDEWAFAIMGEADCSVTPQQILPASFALASGSLMSARKEDLATDPWFLSTVTHMRLSRARRTRKRLAC